MSEGHWPQERGRGGRRGREGAAGRAAQERVAEPDRRDEVAGQRAAQTRHEAVCRAEGDVEKAAARLAREEGPCEKRFELRGGDRLVRLRVQECQHECRGSARERERRAYMRDALAV